MNFVPVLVVNTFTIFFIFSFVFGFIINKNKFSNKLILILILILNSFIYLISSAGIFSLIINSLWFGDFFYNNFNIPLLPFFLLYGAIYSIAGSFLIKFFTKKSFGDLFLIVSIPMISMCVVIAFLYVLQNFS